ncbi:MAG TPA: GspE/PulE family protein [Candidatus Didemnitutus sp.]|nr:GspE/PulE family protein [Candidatus Didemnitutus sp.]
MDEVLTAAVRDRASDVHFEPFEEEFQVRRRIDGAFQLLPPPPVPPAPVISRLKVLGGLDIAERRRPQDGRISLRIGERAIDLRISTLPTQTGESVVLRVLDPDAARHGLRTLGLPAELEASIGRAVRRPHGLVLVTGPTGSGKTTTLYACLDLVNSSDTKILTVEDPVEYEVEGPVQVSINPAAGLTFGRALRSFLRQDPDIILVGEIRDSETAQIAVQAALSGHLVLSTLHTNDAVGAIERLVDLEVEPFLLASTVQAVLAQRLLRRVCPHCRRLVPATSLGVLPELMGTDFAGRTVPVAVGCAQCEGSGYRGRLALFEWFEVSEAAKAMIAGRAAPRELRACARAGGLVPLRDVALRLVFEGSTTLDELLRYT